MLGLGLGLGKGNYILTSAGSIIIDDYVIRVQNNDGAIEGINCARASLNRLNRIA